MTAPEPQAPKRGADFRKAARAALSAQARTRRAKATTYTRRADRPARAEYKPGGNRRTPPPAPEGGEET